MGFFPLLAFRTESYHTSKMELFPKIVKAEKPFTVFFGKVLNMLVNWLPKLKILHV